MSAPTADVREPPRLRAEPPTMPLVKPIAREPPMSEEKGPPITPRLAPSVMEAAMAVASQKATARGVRSAPAKKREKRRKKMIQAAKAAAMRAVQKEHSHS